MIGIKNHLCAHINQQQNLRVNFAGVQICRLTCRIAGKISAPPLLYLHQCQTNAVPKMNKV